MQALVPQHWELSRQNCPFGMHVEQTPLLQVVPEQQSEFVAQAKPWAVQHLLVLLSQSSPSQQPSPQAVPLPLQQRPPAQIVPPQQSEFASHELNVLGQLTHVPFTQPFELSQQSSGVPQESPTNEHSPPLDELLVMLPLLLLVGSPLLLVLVLPLLLVVVSGSPPPPPSELKCVRGGRAVPQDEAITVIRIIEPAKTLPKCFIATSRGR